MVEPLDTAKARSLCEAATPGEWRANLHHTRVQAGRTYGTIIADAVVPLAAVTLGVEGMPEDEGRANAAFIAAARTLLPAALDEIERLRARVAELEGAYDQARNINADLSAYNARLRRALAQISSGNGYYGSQAREYKEIARSALSSDPTAQREAVEESDLA